MVRCGPFKVAYVLLRGGGALCMHVRSMHVCMRVIRKLEAEMLEPWLVGGIRGRGKGRCVYLWRGSLTPLLDGTVR